MRFRKSQNYVDHSKFSQPNRLGGCEGEEEGGSKFLVILALDIEFSWLWPNICNPGIRMLWSDAKGSERGGRRKEAGSAGIENRSCVRIIPVAVVGVNTTVVRGSNDHRSKLFH